MAVLGVEVLMRVKFTEEKIMSAQDALEVIFPNRKTQLAAHIFVEWLKMQGGYASKNAVSRFADGLQKGDFMSNKTPFKYSRRNFYMTVLRTLVEMGFISRNVPVYVEKSGKTLYVYSRNLFDIPLKPPSVGFWRLSYYVCRKWNELFK
ncbi:MAG: hypothetical protein HYU39_01065 [Thaumarchaeota archaeon]|nr:hypothetical protein [Nitrososphaerota archaeon]